MVVFPRAIANRNPANSDYDAWCRIICDDKEFYYHYYITPYYVDFKSPRIYKLTSKTTSAVAIFIKSSVSEQNKADIQTSINRHIKEHLKSVEGIPFILYQWNEKAKCYVPLKDPYPFEQIEKDIEAKQLERELRREKQLKRDALLYEWEYYLDHC
jgi:hypothetical protein